MPREYPRLQTVQSSEHHTDYIPWSSSTPPRANTLSRLSSGLVPIWKSRLLNPFTTIRGHNGCQNALICFLIEVGSVAATLMADGVVGDMRPILLPISKQGVDHRTASGVGGFK